MADGGDMAMLVAVIMPAGDMGTAFPVPPWRMGRPVVLASSE